MLHRLQNKVQLNFIGVLLIRAFSSTSFTCPRMSLKTPQEINEMWFGPDRSKFNDPTFIKSLMGKWFSRTVPEVETTFISEKDQIDRLIDETNLDEKWFTPEGTKI